MIPFIRQRIDAHHPDVNPLIGHGMATHDLRTAQDDIEQILRAAFRNLDPIRFEGLRRLPPEEALMHASSRKVTRRVYDLAPKHLFAVALKISVDGDPVPERVIYLPWMEPGNLFNVNGANFRISPVHNDRVISVDPGAVFMRLNRAKLRFNRIPYHYLTDDPEKPRETVQLVWSHVYNDPSSEKRKGGRAITTMGHYLFAKFGPIPTFQRYAGITPIIGIGLTKENLPPGDWIICRASGQRPKGPTPYEIPDVRVAIPRASYTPNVRYLLVAFFYTLDQYAGRTQLQDFLDQRTWIITLGASIWKLDESYSKLMQNVATHLSSLDEYMDQQVHTKLALSGYHCETVYDLFMLALSQMDYWMVSQDKERNSSYGKELSVNYHVLYDIMAQVFRLVFRLNSAKRDTPDRLTAKRVGTLIQTLMKPGVIFKCTKNNHGEVSGFSFPGDSMLMLACREMIPQVGSTRGRRGSNSDVKGLHHSLAEVHTANFMTKSTLGFTSHGQLNPFLQRDASGLIKPNPDFFPYMKGIEQELVLMGQENSSGVEITEDDGTD